MPGEPLPNDPADLRAIRDELVEFLRCWQPVVDAILASGRRPRLPRSHPRRTLFLAAPYLDLSLDPSAPFDSPRDITFLFPRALALLDDVRRAIEIQTAT